jgi:hypothetical protein
VKSIYSLLSLNNISFWRYFTCLFFYFLKIISFQIQTHPDGLSKMLSLGPVSPHAVDRIGKIAQQNDNSIRRGKLGIPVLSLQWKQLNYRCFQIF